MIETTNLDHLIQSLKEKEIMRQRMKIVDLSKSIIEHPEEELYLSFSLKQSLERLERLESLLKA